MGKYFKEDNQRISKVLNGVDVNALSQNSIRTAGIDKVLSLLGKLTKPEIQVLFMRGDLYKKGGQLQIKNLGSVMNFLKIGPKAETLASNPIFNIVTSLVASKGIQLILSLVKNLPILKTDARITKLLEKRYNVSVYSGKNKIGTELTSLENLLTQLATKGENGVRVQGKQLAPQADATFDQILKDINEIEIIARKNKAINLGIVTGIGAAATGVPTYFALNSPEQKAANARRDLSVINSDIKNLSHRGFASLADWNVAGKVKAGQPGNRDVILNSLRQRGDFDEAKFMKIIQEAEEAAKNQR